MFCYFVIIIVYLQSALLHSQPKSTVGTPAYIAPEVLHRKEYDGKVKQCIALFIESCTTIQFAKFLAGG